MSNLFSLLSLFMRNLGKGIYFSHDEGLIRKILTIDYILRWGSLESNKDVISSGFANLSFALVAFLLVSSSAIYLTTQQTHRISTKADAQTSYSDGRFGNGATKLGTDEMDFGPAEPHLTLSGNNYIDIAHNGSLQLTAFTISAWFKTNMNIPLGKNIFIVGKGELGSEQPGTNLNYGMYMTPSERIEAGFESSDGTDYFVRSPKSYNNYQWHHTAVTYDGHVIRLYIDGVQVRNTFIPTAGPDTTGEEPLRIGAENLLAETAPRRTFNGLIDEVRVWDRALSDVEIAEGYAEGKFDTAGEVLHLPFG